MSGICMDAISLTQHSFALKAKHNPEHRFKDLYHIICQQDWIEHALSAVLANEGARTAGIDQVTRQDFKDVTYRIDFVNDLRAELKSRAYQPTPARRKWIPKPIGHKLRFLGNCQIDHIPSRQAVILRSERSAVQSGICPHLAKQKSNPRKAVPSVIHGLSNGIAPNVPQRCLLTNRSSHDSAS